MLITGRRAAVTRRVHGGARRRCVALSVLVCALLAVPVCAGAAQRTWAETVGGVAHTWSNYRDAGGRAGPLIAANHTVAIACRVRGFKVPDGNRWWYRIASRPWRDAYYVSADAFYNNGATRGSLLNTPFVDARVALCR